MERFQNILFPVDFSDHDRAVAPAAAALARRFGAELTLLHALDLPAGAYADWTAFLTLTDVSAYRRQARQRLDFFLREELAGITVHRQLADGPAAPAIVEFARESSMDLIVLPTRGLSPFRSLLMGSVTERVLHDTACPVWTEAHCQADETPPVDYKSILCAVDLSHASAGVLRWANRMAREYGAALHVVHAAQQDWPELEAANRESYARLAAEAGVAAGIEFLNGPVTATVLAAARRHEADLLVIGRGHLSGTLGRLRTHAHQLIRESHCPVLSI